MAALQPLGAHQVGHAVGQHVEEHRAVVMVEEEAVVERGGFACDAQELLVAQHAVQDQIGQDALLLLPPGLAVMEGETMPFLARCDQALHHVVPATTLGVTAHLRHHLGDLAREDFVFGLRLVAEHAHQVPRDLQIVADHATVLLPHVGAVMAPVLVELLLHEGAVVVVREMLGDGVEGVFEHLPVAFLAGGQEQVDQVGGSVVADRVPVLLATIGAERIAARIERDRIEVREITAELLVLEEAVEQIDRHLGILEDLRVAGNPVGLDRAGQRVDLLVGRDRVEIVAELGREDLGLAAAVAVDTVVPVHDVLVEIDETHVLAQVFGTLLGAFQITVVTGQHVGGGEAIHQPGDRVGLLAIVVHVLLAGDLDRGPVVVVIDRLIAELRAQIEVAQLANLAHPPVALLEREFIGLAAREHQVLRDEVVLTEIVVEDPVGLQITPRHQHVAHLVATPLARLVQVVGDPGIGIRPELDLELLAVRGLERELVGFLVKIDQVASNHVGKGSIHRVHR